MCKLNKVLNACKQYNICCNVGPNLSKAVLASFLVSWHQKNVVKENIIK